jgi:DNA polymerase-3 subunit gamma/tau
MGTVLQRMAVVQAVPERAHDADPSDPDAPQVTALAQAMPADETQLLYSLCLHGRAELGLAPDEYAALTMVLLRLLAFKPTEKKSLKTASAPTEAPVAAAPVAATQRPTPVPNPASAPKPEPLPQPKPAMVPAMPQAPAVVAIAVREQGEPSERDRPQPYVPETTLAPTLLAPSVQTPEGDFWFDTVSALLAAEAITAMTRELALQAQLVAKDEAQWVLRLERESLNQPNNRDRLTVALNNAGHAVSLVVEVGPVVDTPARRLLAVQAERQRQAEDTIMADPFVQTLMRDYGGKIVPGSLQPMDV